VQHGFGCSEAGDGHGEDFIGLHIQDRAVIPPGYDTATVFSNGWRLEYQSGDHHVLGLGSAIYNITRIENELRWEAGGVLTDKNGDDAFRWCYNYTLLFWNADPLALDATPHHTDSAPYPLTFVHPDSHDPSNNTALRDLPGIFMDTTDRLQAAVVPRGFGLTWLDLGGDIDHHVLQVGFDLGALSTTGNTVAWTSQTILKDNAQRRDYRAAAYVSVLSGQDVEMWQPATVLHLTGIPPTWVKEATDFALSPAEPTSSCSGVGHNEHTEEYMVEDVPFDYAIPVLVGWDLQYVCTDHHVKRVEARVVDFQYDKGPEAATGTLRYTISSSLADASANVSAAQYKVSILGLKRTQ
jgi:hypothetical protein